MHGGRAQRADLGQADVGVGQLARLPVGDQGGVADLGAQPQRGVEAVGEGLDVVLDEQPHPPLGDGVGAAPQRVHGGGAPGGRHVGRSRRPGPDPYPRGAELGRRRDDGVELAGVGRTGLVVAAVGADPQPCARAGTAGRRRRRAVTGTDVPVSGPLDDLGPGVDRQAHDVRNGPLTEGDRRQPQKQHGR